MDSLRITRCGRDGTRARATSERSTDASFPHGDIDAWTGFNCGHLAEFDIRATGDRRGNGGSDEIDIGLRVRRVEGNRVRVTDINCGERMHFSGDVHFERRRLPSDAHIDGNVVTTVRAFDEAALVPGIS